MGLNFQAKPLDKIWDRMISWRVPLMLSSTGLTARPAQSCPVGPVPALIGVKL